MICPECQGKMQKITREGWECPDCLRVGFSSPPKTSREIREKARSLYESSKVLPDGDCRVESYGLRKETILKIIGKDGDKHFRITPETLPKIGKVIRSYREGDPVKKIAQSLSMNRSTVYRTFVVWNALTVEQRRTALNGPAKKEEIVEELSGGRSVPEEKPRERFTVWLRSIRSPGRARRPALHGQGVQDDNGTAGGFFHHHHPAEE